MEKGSREYYLGLEFFGRITASISHELNNVLTIINELNGVLEDTVCMADPGKGIDPGKIGSVQQRISKQLKRGNSIIKKLNRFSHTIDHPVTDFDLNGLMLNFTEIYRRLSDLKKINVEYKLSAAAINIESDPFLVQHLVFRGINEMIEGMDANTTINITAIEAESNAEIELKSESYNDKFPEDTSGELKSLAAGADIDIEIGSQGAECMIKIMIPKKINN